MKARVIKTSIFFQAVIFALVSISSLPHTSPFQTENWIYQANAFLRDLKFRLRGPEKPSGDVVVVTIGEDSLAQIGEWPWKRRYQAALIDAIFKKGAKNIGLDIVWPERNASELYDNQILQSVLKKYSSQITFAWMAQCVGKECEPSKEFSDTIENDPFFEIQNSSSGFVNASKSARGKIDKAYYFLSDGNQKLPSMPLATAAKRLQVDPASLITKDWSYLNLSSRNRTLPRIEATCFFDQMESDCDLPNDFLKEKTVILGVSALGIGDQVATAFDKVVDGVEIQADITDQILHHRIPQHWPWPTWLILVILSAGFLLLSISLRNLQLLIAFLGTLTLIFTADLILFSQNIFLDSAFFYANVVFIALSSFGFRFYQEFQQKQFLRSAFSRYLSPEVVKVLIKNPEVLQLGGQKKEITILFCDLRNFTGISEKLDPEKLTSLLNEILTLLTEVIFKYGGTVDKYIGDAVMAFFNAPLDQPNHASQACNAAREMARRISERQQSFQIRYGVEIQIGIGVNTGEAHVGNLGSEQRFNYSALGDAVNTASRVESATKEKRVSILTTRATLEAIEKAQGEVPGHRSVGQIILKGKTHSVELFEVLELS